MSLTAIFFIAMLVAFLAAVPPGLLNMTAAKISIKEGYTRGIMFSIGASLIFMFQTLIATVFARYLTKHPDVIDVLQQVAFVIFVLITIYFLLIAKKQNKPDTELETKSKRSRFFQGIFLSSINMFPIPFQAYITITFASFGWLTFDKIGISTYVAGAAMGSFANLYVYIFFFDKIKKTKETSQKKMNYIIGIITGVISIITLISILRKYY
ncbi:LysE family transporter [Xanthomarina sp. F2636L]|uniref:LysE family transporter n=1 Tax=Xanthomarina sp. F2636L TaxID=2996018 RepID=UPI00225E3DF7|nr:LysE family transporter [Xanthomarina sp. F2636L]MCX7550989.1 LysE family transporter [Xanthomarina sp. F2636L]